MFKKDNWILGVSLGIIVPLVVYGIIFSAVKYWGTIDETLNIYIIKASTMHLAGIFVNMFTFRYYMVNLKFDKTGRGILLATFAYAGLFVYLHVL
jgi:hypothetical protein